MKKGKKRYTKKDVYKTFFTAFFLVILVTAIGYFILSTDWLRPSINEISASYISLNTAYKTDMLKITNLQRLSDNKGISKSNKNSKTFQITGEIDSTYKIVLYHLGERIDEKNVHFYLENENNKTMTGLLSDLKETEDGGKLVFEGTIKDGKNWNLKLWVSKEYNDNINNVSYEIRIKTS